MLNAAPQCTFSTTAASKTGVLAQQSSRPPLGDCSSTHTHTHTQQQQQQQQQRKACSKHTQLQALLL